MKDRIEKIFKEVFDNEDFILDLHMSSDEVPEWDSMTHIQLVLALEQEFHIKFNTQQIAEMNSVKKIMTVIKEMVR